MLCFLDVDYVNTVGNIRASSVRDNDDVLRIVLRCTALISTHLDNIGGSLQVKGESDKGNTGSIGPVQISAKAPMDCEGPTVE